jgi:hypothetical protein
LRKPGAYLIRHESKPLFSHHGFFLSFKAAKVEAPFAEAFYTPSKTDRQPIVTQSYRAPKIDFTYFKIGFWDGLSPKVGGGLFCF